MSAVRFRPCPRERPTSGGALELSMVHYPPTIDSRRSLSQLCASRHLMVTAIPILAFLSGVSAVLPSSVVRIRDAPPAQIPSLSTHAPPSVGRAYIRGQVSDIRAKISFRFFLAGHAVPRLLPFSFLLPNFNPRIRDGLDSSPSDRAIPGWPPDGRSDWPH